MRVPLAAARLLFLLAYSRWFPFLDFTRHEGFLTRLRGRIMTGRGYVPFRRGRMHMKLDLRHGLDLLLWIGRFERELLGGLDRLLKQGDVVVDVGAHIGAITLECAVLVGSEGRVEAFEPLSPVRERLCAHLRENGLTNVRVHACALGETPGTARLSVPTDPAFASLGTPSAGGPVREVVPVTVDTLDEFCLRQDLRRIDLLKVDVEGWEIPVLKGAGRILSEGRVGAIIVEYNREAQRRAGFGDTDLILLLRATHPRILPIAVAGEGFDASAPPVYAELLCLPAGGGEAS